MSEIEPEPSLKKRAIESGRARMSQFILRKNRNGSFLVSTITQRKTNQEVGH